MTPFENLMGQYPRSMEGKKFLGAFDVAKIALYILELAFYCILNGNFYQMVKYRPTISKMGDLFSICFIKKRFIFEKINSSKHDKYLFYCISMRQFLKEILKLSESVPSAPKSGCLLPKILPPTPNSMGASSLKKGR